jgi:hypothetical protein
VSQRQRLFAFGRAQGVKSRWISPNWISSGATFVRRITA